MLNFGRVALQLTVTMTLPRLVGSTLVQQEVEHPSTLTTFGQWPWNLPKAMLGDSMIMATAHL